MQTNETTGIYQILKEPINIVYPADLTANQQGILILDNPSTINILRNTSFSGATHILKYIPENAKRIILSYDLFGTAATTAFIMIQNNEYLQSSNMLYPSVLSVWFSQETTILLNALKTISYTYHDRGNTRYIIYIRGWELER